MRSAVVLSSSLGAVALLALTWWGLYGTTHHPEPAAGGVTQDAELPVPGPAGDQLMAATQSSDDSVDAALALDDDSPGSREAAKAAPQAGSDSALLRQWQEMQEMFPKNPFSTEWWRWRLGFVLKCLEEDQAARVGRELQGAKERLEAARALDRIAIVCLLDCRGHYTLCESVESASGTEGEKFVFHEYGRHYTFLPNEFPEWATLVRLEQSFNEEDGTLADSTDRLSGAMQDARRRFEEALKAVGG